MADSTHPLRHVAIIMDGNNRWAKDRGLAPLSGHQAGAERLREIIECCQQHDIEVLTVFAFSSENWKRSRQEVGGLMSLFSSSLKRYRKDLVEQNIRLQVIGRRDRFSQRLQKQIQDVEEATAAGQRTLVIAADYGGRWDIAQAAARLAGQVADGKITATEIDEVTLHSFTCLSDLPEPDLLIRTGAECRISNFLLWQLAYTELFFANCYWPDFDRAWFTKAIKEYRRRVRRFGTNPDLEEIDENAASRQAGVQG